MNMGFIRIIRWSNHFIYIMEISPASVYCNSCLIVIDKNITKQHKLLTEAHAATKLQVIYFPQIYPHTSIDCICVWVFHHLIMCYFVLGPEGQILDIWLILGDEGGPCFSVSWVPMGHGNPRGGGGHSKNAAISYFQPSIPARLHQFLSNFIYLSYIFKVWSLGR